MDIGIAEVRKSEEKKTLGGAESNIEGAEFSIGGPRTTPKVYKLTPARIGIPTQRTAKLCNVFSIHPV